MLGTGDVLGHIHSLSPLLLYLLLAEHAGLQLLLLGSDEVGLLENCVLPLDVAVCLLQLHNGVEPSPLEVLVQEHAVRQHLLDVSDLDRHQGRQIRAVNLDHSRVALIEAPDQDSRGDVVELSSSLEVQRLVLLNWRNRQAQQVWSAWDVPLQLNVNILHRLEVLDHIDMSHHDFFLAQSHKEWSNETVVCPFDSVGSSVREHEINIFELISCADDSSNELFIMELLKSVGVLSHTNGVKVDLLVRVNSFSNVLLPHLLR